MNIEQIQARCDAATPGPWTASLCEWECNCYPIPSGCDREPHTCGNGHVIAGAFVPQTKTVEWGGDYCDMNDADADFIAHAREDLPWALSELAAERAKTAAYREAEAKGRIIPPCERCEHKWHLSHSTSLEVFNPCAHCGFARPMSYFAPAEAEAALSP